MTNNTTILPLTYPILPVDMSLLSDNTDNVLTKISNTVSTHIMSTVSTHIMSTVKNIFSVISSYTGIDTTSENYQTGFNEPTNLTIPKLYDIRIDNLHDDNIADIV
jgi:hypothetical protein